MTGSATVIVSAENPADGQTVLKAVDGVVDGYPTTPSAEWVAPSGGAGTWIQLGWAKATTLNEIALADRPNANDQVLAGTLTFSDGSSVTVPALANGGTVQKVTFTARPVTWARFTVTSVSSSTENIDLAEIRALSSTASTTPALKDVTASAQPSASSDNPADEQTVAKGVDGVVSGYRDDYTAEWVAPGGRTGVWYQLDWTAPVSLQRIVQNDRPNSADQITSGTLTFSDGSQVAVGALPNDGTARTIDFAARNVTWVRLTTTGVSASTINVGLAEVRAWAAG
ncbi:hypothetical protein GCM10017714_04600 [Curtobacterium pusillum]|uniref:DUF7402 domain-containing protein n=1 Tax=Curtobacterium pusillum TaxID=69373 RepID=A0ABX2MF74_9MICO|nr:hypothetical protein [Curtobacterium pusillum]NUU14001.1 hypothetical protein [Curtobacterium pusillum]GLK29723.1 hypothetical protein GCM10017610_00080 [Curtobacterium pusillum]